MKKNAIVNNKDSGCNNELLQNMYSSPTRNKVSQCDCYYNNSGNRLYSNSNSINLSKNKFITRPQSSHTLRNKNFLKQLTSTTSPIISNKKRGMFYCFNNANSKAYGCASFKHINKTNGDSSSSNNIFTTTYTVSDIHSKQSHIKYNVNNDNKVMNCKLKFDSTNSNCKSSNSNIIDKYIVIYKSRNHHTKQHSPIYKSTSKFNSKPKQIHLYKHSLRINNTNQPHLQMKLPLSPSVQQFTHINNKQPKHKDESCLYDICKTSIYDLYHNVKYSQKLFESHKSFKRRLHFHLKDLWVKEKEIKDILFEAKKLGAVADDIATTKRLISTNTFMDMKIKI